jgi:hypothetical protein
MTTHASSSRKPMSIQPLHAPISTTLSQEDHIQQTAQIEAICSISDPLTKLYISRSLKRSLLDLYGVDNIMNTRAHPRYNYNLEDKENDKISRKSIDQSSKLWDAYVRTCELSQLYKLSLKSSCLGEGLLLTASRPSHLREDVEVEWGAEGDTLIGFAIWSKKRKRIIHRPCRCSWSLWWLDWRKKLGESFSFILRLVRLLIF